MEKIPAVKKEKKDLMFAGASSLMVKPTTQKEATERKLVVLVARALKINPMGVVIFANLPYVANQGRKEKLAEYEPTAQFEYDYVQIAKDDTEKAIVKCRVIVGDKALSGWVIGECSPATTKMGSLKGYQNHMAQTRAENRAFEAAYGVRFRKELFEGIAKELEGGHTTPEVAELASSAANTSAEEAVDIERGRKSSTDGTYDKAIKAIMNKTDKADLEAVKEKVKGSTLYSADQKGQLERLIDGRIASL